VVTLREESKAASAADEPGAPPAWRDAPHTSAETSMTTSPVGTSSFDQFFVANHQQMVRALGLILGDAELGCDAASEGFTKALHRWNKVSKFSLRVPSSSEHNVTSCPILLRAERDMHDEHTPFTSQAKLAQV
jgi:hypothetical protein